MSQCRPLARAEALDAGGAVLAFIACGRSAGCQWGRSRTTTSSPRARPAVSLIAAAAVVIEVAAGPRLYNARGFSFHMPPSLLTFHHARPQAHLIARGNR